MAWAIHVRVLLYQRGLGPCPKVELQRYRAAQHEFEKKIQALESHCAELEVRRAGTPGSVVEESRDGQRREQETFHRLPTLCSFFANMICCLV